MEVVEEVMMIVDHHHHQAEGIETSMNQEVQEEASALHILEDLIREGIEGMIGTREGEIVVSDSY
jgi:hypothetical protein